MKLHGFEHLHIDWTFAMLDSVAKKTVTCVKPHGTITSLGSVSSGLMPLSTRSSGRVRDAAGKWQQKVKEAKKRKYRSIDDPWET